MDVPWRSQRTLGGLASVSPLFLPEWDRFSGLRPATPVPGFFLALSPNCVGDRGADVQNGGCAAPYTVVPSSSSTTREENTPWTTAFF